MQVASLAASCRVCSYVYLQTVFSMRASVNHRLNGLVVTIVEVVVFALPFSVVQVGVLGGVGHRTLMHQGEACLSCAHSIACGRHFRW